MARGRLFAATRHLAYLERDGVERDGTPGRLYGAGEAFNREAFAEPLPGEKRQFRFIVSPENARNLDLQAFARGLVAQMEEDLGRRLVWAAVIVLLPYSRRRRRNERQRHPNPGRPRGAFTHQPIFETINQESRHEPRTHQPSRTR
jgi:hypothetical protein